MFREAWSKFDPKGTCYIQHSELVPLCGNIEPPLGFKGMPMDRHIFEDWVKNVHIPVYIGECHQFYEVGFHLMKRFYEQKE